MGFVESVGGLAAEALLLVAIVTIGVPLLLLLARLVRGEFAPDYLVAQYREGKEDVDD